MKVEGMDTEMAPEPVVRQRGIAAKNRHRSDDASEKLREERLVPPRTPKDRGNFEYLESNSTWWRRFESVEKRMELKWGVESVKPGWGIYRGVGDEICEFLQFFSNFWSSNGHKRSYSNG